MMKKSSAFILEKLEPRLLFSGEGVIAPVDSLPLQAEASAVLYQPHTDLNLSADQDKRQALEVNELIFVDTGIEGYQQLIDDLKSSGDDKQQYAFYLLDAQRDGITQISDTLKQYQGVTAVHLVSHGDDGKLHLGNTLLTTANFNQYSAQIQGWQQALSDQADFLFYSCSLAQGEEGQALLQGLQQLTGADVAASVDATGSSVLGGDWELEYQQGEIETVVPISAATQQDWSGILATINVTTTNDVVDGGDGVTSLREAVIQANGTGAVDTIVLGPGTYTLSIGGVNENSAATGDLDITRDLIIQGADATTTIIDGNSLDRVFDLLNNDLTIDNVTITGGDVVGGGGGGLLLSNATSITTINNSVISGNSTQNSGGAINNAGTLILDNVFIGGNHATLGGGIDNSGSATLNNVTIDANTADNHGGGINNSGPLTLTNVTISNNQAGFSPPAGEGGGIKTSTAITADQVTIAFNSAPTGGGLHTAAPGQVTLTNSIIGDNTSPSPTEAYTSDGSNIIMDGGTISNDPTADIIADPQLINNLNGSTIYKTLDETPGGPADINPVIGAQAPANTDNLVVHLEFEDGGGTLAADSTTNNNDATLAVGSQQDWVAGKIGNAFNFDFSVGNEDYFKILNSGTTENVQEGSFTLAAWFKPEDIPEAPDDLAYGIIGKEGNHTGLWYTSGQRFGFEHTLAGPSYPTIYSANTFAPGSFYHVAVTVDRTAGTMTLYVNGQFEGTNSFTPGAAAIEYGTQAWRVGTIRDTFGGSIDFPAKGTIDDVRIYANALSGSAVQALFHLGNTAPTITSSAVTTATEDAGYSYTFTVNDVDTGDTLTLSAPTLPSWLNFNTSTGVLSGTPTDPAELAEL